MFFIIFVISFLLFFEGYGDHRDLHLRTHSFPTRRSSDLVLRGKPGARRVEVTARGKAVRDLSTQSDVQGKTVHLAIDAELQYYAARRIGPESGSVVVIDCLTGDVLAMASMPSFDPNSFSSGIGVRSEEHTSELQSLMR